jgi:hypothetical protein
VDRNLWVDGLAGICVMILLSLWPTAGIPVCKVNCVMRVGEVLTGFFFHYNLWSKTTCERDPQKSPTAISAIINLTKNNPPPPKCPILHILIILLHHVQPS